MSYNFQAAYDALDDAESKRQVLMLQDTLKLGGSILSKIPDMIAAQIIGRLASSKKAYKTFKYNILNRK